MTIIITKWCRTQRVNSYATQLRLALFGSGHHELIGIVKPVKLIAFSTGVLQDHTESMILKKLWGGIQETLNIIGVLCMMRNDIAALSSEVPSNNLSGINKFIKGWFYLGRLYIRKQADKIQVQCIKIYNFYWSVGRPDERNTFASPLNSPVNLVSKDTSATENPQGFIPSDNNCVNTDTLL